MIEILCILGIGYLITNRARKERKQINKVISDYNKIEPQPSVKPCYYLNVGKCEKNSYCSKKEDENKCGLLKEVKSCEGCTSYRLLCLNDVKRDDCKDYSQYQKEK